MPPRDNNHRLVNSDNAAISEIWLLKRDNVLRLVNPDNAAISEIWLLQRDNVLSLVAYSSPVKSLIDLSTATSDVSVAMSARVIVAPRALFKLSKITARSLASGITTISPPPPLLTVTRTPVEQLLRVSVSPLTLATHAP